MITINVANAGRMMIDLSIDDTWTFFRVTFADWRKAEVPLQDVQNALKTSLNLRSMHLDTPYEITAKSENGETVHIPWDFIRHYADPHFEESDRHNAQSGRQILGQRVRTLRESRKLSQTELAENAGIGRVTLSRLESGEQSPRFETLQRLAAYLKIPVVQLLVEAPTPSHSAKAHQPRRARPEKSRTGR